MHVAFSVNQIVRTLIAKACVRAVCNINKVNLRLI